MFGRKKNGQPIVIEDDRMDGGNVNSIGLKIQQVLRSDMGNYTCELQNEYGVGASENAISLDVHCKCQKNSENIHAHTHARICRNERKSEIKRDRGMVKRIKAGIA